MNDRLISRITLRLVRLEVLLRLQTAKSTCKIVMSPAHHGTLADHICKVAVLIRCSL